MAKSAFEVVVFDLMKSIHVELPDEAIHFIVPEVFWQDDFLEFGCIFDHELQAARRPVNYLLVLFVLNQTPITETISKALKTKPATSLSYCCFVALSRVELTETSISIMLLLDFNYIFYHGIPN